MVLYFIAGFILFISGCDKDDPYGPGTDPVDQPEWIIGADLSLVTKLQKAGAVYRDFQGKKCGNTSFFST